MPRNPSARSRPAPADAPSPCEAVGYVEVVTPFRVAGWAMDLNAPQWALDLALRVDGQVVCHFRPQYTRPALNEKLGLGPERVGLVWFELRPPAFVSDGRPHRLEVLAVRSGAVLPAVGLEVSHDERRAPWPPPAAVKTPAAAQRARSRKAPAFRPEVSVIVLNRNGQALLPQLFESWQRHDRSPFGVEWIVIDHGSTDQSLQVLRAWRNRLRLRVVALEHNDSFSSSCNRGARLAQAPHLLFLNNDIGWCSNALPQMLKSLQPGGACAVGLKLLKDVPDSAMPAPVQHLGVRFTLRHAAYWPYEAGEEQLACESAYTAQAVPAVTGAALLCRASDFHAVGGFHTGYFYGFEDVELCLRLSQHTSAPVVCRNDLVALHLHGHTRLTGREGGLNERLARNEQALQAHRGAWLKRHWWQSLVTGDGHLCTEPLVVGLVPGPGVQRLAAHLKQVRPATRILLLPRRPGPHDLRDLHILVVADPRFELGAAAQRRADLVVLALVAGRSRGWPALMVGAGDGADTGPWNAFDACLRPGAGTGRRAAGGAQASAMAVYDSTPSQPLGPFLGPESPLRVAVVPASSQPQGRRRAQGVAAAVRAQGALSRVQGTGAEPRHWVADVMLHLGAQSADEPGCVNIRWAQASRKGQPVLALMAQRWELEIGSAVPAP